MNAQDPNFFTLMLFASTIAYGILPAFAPALVILCGLWLLGSHPLIAIALAALWLLKWVIWDFFVALIVGFGGGLGLRASGVSDHRHLGNLFVTCGSNVEEVSVMTPELRIIPLAFHAFMASIASASAADLYEPSYQPPPPMAYRPPGSPPGVVFYAPNPTPPSPCLPGFFWRVYPDGNGECWPSIMPGVVFYTPSTGRCSPGFFWRVYPDGNAECWPWD